MKRKADSGIAVKVLTEEEINKILSKCDEEVIRKVSVLSEEDLARINYEELIKE